MDATHDDEDATVLYEVRGSVAWVTMNRPRYRNAQTARMTEALDDAFGRAVADDAVGAIALAGAGPCFSAGHDIGTPARDIHRSAPRRSTPLYDHRGRPPVEDLYVREAELYLGMCRRWRELPKPLIASVHGACVAGGLMLAWIADLIVASDDAWFADPVVRMGIPGVEYFAHPFALPPRVARELLFLGEPLGAARAFALGMVNRVVPRSELEEATQAWGERLAAQPRFGLLLAKRAVHQAEDRMGLRDAMDGAFALHHVAHAHNLLSGRDHLAGEDARSMARRGGGA